MDSVGTRLTDGGGRSAGFDYVRLTLAASVIFFHSRPLMLGASPHSAEGAVAHQSFSLVEIVHNLVQPIEWMAVPSFFALSGFLVAASLLRSKTTLEFTMLRVLRIVPALFFETMIFAFIAGPMVTTIPLSEYFTSPLLWSYPRNIIGDMHYFLPGVFLNNPHPRYVNGQLWTIPAELDCYLLLILVSLAKLARFKATIPVTLLIITPVLLALQFLTPYGPLTWHMGGSHVAEVSLFLCFLAGVSLFVYRDAIPLHPVLFVASILLSYGLLWDGKFQYLVAIPIAYATTFVGLAIRRPSFVTRLSDYSYGIYLYGFPIQQLFALLFPSFLTLWFITGFIAPLVVTTGIAAVSWVALESPILERRKKIIAAVQNVFDRHIARFLRWRPTAPEAEEI